MRAKITKRLVDGMVPGQTCWDTELRGFAVRCSKGGGKSYTIKYRSRGGDRWYAIGPHGSPWTAEEARKEALRLLGLVAAGKDPAGERAAQFSSPTVEQLADRYLTLHARPNKKPRSALMDEINLRLHVLPRLGAKRVADVERPDIARLMAEMHDRQGAANRTLALLNKMFGLAEVWGYRRDGSNPCRRVPKYREVGRQRYLSPEEIQRLEAALRQAEAGGTVVPQFTALIRLLLLTGARLGEIQTARWSDVDWTGGLLRLADSKTGAKSIPLAPAALAILRHLPRVEGNPYILFGKCDGGHLVAVQKPWQRVRAIAGMEDVRIHDLRHTFASISAQAGHSLHVIGAMLGHRHTATTARYAHLTRSAVSVAAAQTAAQLAQHLSLASGHDQPEPPVARIRAPANDSAALIASPAS